MTAIAEPEAAGVCFPDGPDEPWEYEGPDGTFITPQTVLGRPTGDLVVRPPGGASQVITAEVLSALTDLGFAVPMTSGGRQ